MQQLFLGVKFLRSWPSTLEQMINLDNIRINEMCLKYENTEGYGTEEYNRASKKIGNVYMDKNTRLGWCVVPKVISQMQYIKKLG